MKTPKRILLSRRKGWRMPPNTVNVARPGKWGNPFVVGTHGTQARCVELYVKLMAGYVCVTTDNTDAQQAAYKHVREHKEKLRGKNLACWCKPNAPCHADVLLELANE